MESGTRVEWSSSFPTRLGLFVIIPPMLAFGALLSLLFHRPNLYNSLLYGAVFLIATAWAVWARRRPALILDAEGIWQHGDTRPVPWSDAALIWVGHDALRRPFRGLRMVVWTQPGLDFARRTGLEPDARLAISHLATTISVDQAAADLERFAPGVVRRGTEISLKRLFDQIRHADR